jgi:hypothetical protein
MGVSVTLGNPDAKLAFPKISPPLFGITFFSPLFANGCGMNVG